MQETQVRSLHWEDLPGEGNGNPLQYFAWEITGQRSLEGYSPCSCKELDTRERLTLALSFNFISFYMSARALIQSHEQNSQNKVGDGHHYWKRGLDYDGELKLA